MNTAPASPEVLRAARELLTEAGADLASVEKTAAAAQGLFRRIYEHLTPRIGDGAFRSLLQLAHRRALKDHPVLDSTLVQAEENPFLGDVSLALEDSPSAEACEALVQVVAESLTLLRALARDQDWDLVELWPGLKALEERGIPVQPDPGQGSLG